MCSLRSLSFDRLQLNVGVMHSTRPPLTFVNAMSLTSDPELKSVDQSFEWQRFAGIRRAALVNREQHLPTPRSRIQVALAYSAIVFTSAVIAMSVVASYFASPLSTIPIAAAPAWSVELSSSSSHSVLALADGPEAGLQVLRVPAVDAVEEPRVIPARLAKGELHMISLGWSSIRARSSAPSDERAMSWSAESRAITAFQHKDGTGVRTSW